MALSKKQRSMLIRLSDAITGFGNQLDYTATTFAKLVDRQQAHRYVNLVIVAVLTEHPDNEYHFQDLEAAEEALQHLEKLAIKEYKDRNGH